MTARRTANRLAITQIFHEKDVFVSQWHGRLGRKLPSTPNRNRTCELLVTSLPLPLSVRRVTGHFDKKFFRYKCNQSSCRIFSQNVFLLHAQTILSERNFCANFTAWVRLETSLYRNDRQEGVRRVTGHFDKKFFRYKCNQSSCRIFSQNVFLLHAQTILSERNFCANFTAWVRLETSLYRNDLFPLEDSWE